MATGSTLTAEPVPVKILVAGGFGVGKTTFVGRVSEIEPLSTEAVITRLSEGVDDLSGVGGKTTTTVALDYGRRTLPTGYCLYLFGTPGQDRFWFMWDDLVRGAIGAVVLVDTRRLADSFSAVDFFEHRKVPFLIAVNDFPDAYPYSYDTVRTALKLAPHVPVTRLDARDGEQCRDTLVALVNYRLNPAAVPENA
ncbi:ATP/GTP-binding protein [Streptomyces sp. NPDC050428]|uniref:GTP-binding protein n=1 Tax=Streptomyces sp. NPDC050428 TaxID=3155757 RepID=UPI00342201E8